MAIFVHPWSVIVRMESYPWDLGSLTIKSIAMVENGGAFGCGKIGERGAFPFWVLTLFLWQSAQPFTYCSTSLAILGHHRCCRRSCVVRETPGCPMVGAS